MICYKVNCFRCCFSPLCFSAFSLDPPPSPFSLSPVSKALMDFFLSAFCCLQAAGLSCLLIIPVLDKGTSQREIFRLQWEAKGKLELSFITFTALKILFLPLCPPSDCPHLLMWIFHSYLLSFTSGIFKGNGTIAVFWVQNCLGAHYPYRWILWLPHLPVSCGKLEMKYAEETLLKTILQMHFITCTRNSRQGPSAFFSKFAGENQEESTQNKVHDEN